MNWQIKYKKGAWKFLSENRLIDRFETTIKLFVKDKTRIDIKKLAGKLKGHYRLRIGKVRAILKFDFKSKIVYVKKADFRGRIYK